LLESDKRGASGSELLPREKQLHDLRPFGAKKVVVLATSRVLLLNYFGVVDRHVETVAPHAVRR
jgi:hypothetical protein